MLAHNVYFTLNDSSDSAEQALVAACKKYLTAPTPVSSSSPAGRSRTS